jgi:hypothetical protein
VGKKSEIACPNEGEKSFDKTEIANEIGGKNLTSFPTTDGKNPWDALRIARQYITSSPNKNTSRISESVIVVRLYESARTHFIRGG